MYLTYKLTRSPFVAATYLGASYCVDALDVFSLYRERFVILPTDTSGSAFVDCCFTYFFSYDNFWWREALDSWDSERRLGLALFSDVLVTTILRKRRGFLLQYGQRRVVTRVSSWFVSDIWTSWSFQNFAGSPAAVPSLFTYRHLAQSDLFSAGILLGQPNLYFFVYILSNPYFWSVLQQTLNSQYRYR